MCDSHEDDTYGSSRTLKLAETVSARQTIDILKQPTKQVQQPLRLVSFDAKHFADLFNRVRSGAEETNRGDEFRHRHAVG